MADKPDVDLAAKWCDENGVLPHHKESLAYLLRAVRLKTIEEIQAVALGRSATVTRYCRQRIAELEAK